MHCRAELLFKPKEKGWKMRKHGERKNYDAGGDFEWLFWKRPLDLQLFAVCQTVRCLIQNPPLHKSEHWESRDLDVSPSKPCRDLSTQGRILAFPKSFLISSSFKKNHELGQNAMP